MAIKKSIYDTAKSIVEQKGKWHTATSKGEDATAYANAAKPSYAALRNNGAGDIADKLEQLDYTQALDYLNTLEVEKEPSTYADQLDEMYGRQANKSDKTYGYIETWGGDIQKQYDDLYGIASGGYYGTDYYDGLSKKYQEMGESAILGELAATGAENSGNIDSYAKAQAQRQQLAYANAGEEAARMHYDAIVNGGLNVLSGKNTAAATAWGAMQDNVTGDQSLYSDMYGYLTSADADKAVAESNALAELYKSQTEVNDSIYKIAEAATKAWAEGQSEYPTAEACANYYNSVLNGLAPVVETPSTEVPAVEPETEPTASKYTDVDRKAVIDKIYGIANEPALSFDKRMSEIERIFNSPMYAEVINGMSEAERNWIIQIINGLQTQIDGQNTNGAIALS